MSNLVFYPEAFERGFFWPYVYFEGLLELQLGHDLVRASLDLADVPDGLHDCMTSTEFGSVPVKLALWSYDRGEGYGIGRKGVIVRADVPKDMEYLTKHFKAKSHCL